MKQIPLKGGQFAIVDDDMFDSLSKYVWRVNKKGYAYRRMGRRRVYITMHRLVLQVESGYVTDHINRNRLDNRRENLRQATLSQNRCNSKTRIDSKSGIKGVHWNPLKKKWRAKIRVNGTYISLGYYLNIVDARQAYMAAARIHHGEFACAG